jgi:hypothetical protein
MGIAKIAALRFACLQQRASNAIIAIRLLDEKRRKGQAASGFGSP